jgi:hypothetical protein
MELSPDPENIIFDQLKVKIPDQCLDCPLASSIISVRNELIQDRNKFINNGLDSSEKVIEVVTETYKEKTGKQLDVTNPELREDLSNAFGRQLDDRNEEIKALGVAADGLFIGCILGPDENGCRSGNSTEVIIALDRASK